MSNPELLEMFSRFLMLSLLAIGGASLGGLAWRRRRQARPVSGPAPQ